MKDQLDSHKKRLVEVGEKLDFIAQQVEGLRGTCRDVLRLDRLLDYDQSWAIHHIANRIAQELEVPDAQPIEFVLSDMLMEMRLEVVPIVCNETPDDGAER